MSWREPYSPPDAPVLYVSWAQFPVKNFSYSLASDIDSCGQKTIYSRFQGLASIKESASFKFGICAEEAIVENLKIGANAEESFVMRWAKFKDFDLEYTSRDQSWSNLLQIGRALMRLYATRKTKPPLSDVLVDTTHGEVYPLETNGPAWYKGTRLDYIADIVGHPLTGPVLLDVKTAGSTYIKDAEATGYAALDPQLQVGALASGIRRVGFIALIKTKSPDVQFVEGYVTDKMVEHRDIWLREQYDKLVEGRLTMRSGVRWPNDHCLMCDYLCKCLGREDLAQKNLRQKLSKDTAQILVSIDEM